jgi:hypothetical protein
VSGFRGVIKENGDLFDRLGVVVEMAHDGLSDIAAGRRPALRGRRGLARFYQLHVHVVAWGFETLKIES